MPSQYTSGGVNNVIACDADLELKEVGRLYVTKKQFQRKEPSKTKWIRASKTCQMNSTLVFSVVVLGKSLMEAKYAPPRRVRTARRDVTVVASI